MERQNLIFIHNYINFRVDRINHLDFHGVSLSYDLHSASVFLLSLASLLSYVFFSGVCGSSALTVWRTLITCSYVDTSFFSFMHWSIHWKVTKLIAFCSWFLFLFLLLILFSSASIFLILSWEAASYHWAPHRIWVTSDLFGLILVLPKTDNNYLILGLTSLGNPTTSKINLWNSLKGVTKSKALKWGYFLISKSINWFFLIHSLTHLSETIIPLDFEAISCCPIVATRGESFKGMYTCIFELTLSYRIPSAFFIEVLN